MKICVLCNDSMKQGQGRALFTAECLHSFHFHCMASYINNSNGNCPICCKRWKDIHFHGPTSYGSHEEARIKRVDLPQVNETSTITLIEEMFTCNLNNRETTFVLQNFEPSIFNDDDSLCSKPHLPSNNSSKISPTDSSNSIVSIDIQTYPQVSAVQRSIILDNFNVIINLKAHLTNRDNQVDDTQISKTFRAPIDLVTVLDVSRSMEGSKIALLKIAMEFVIHQLGPSDRLSIVAFSSSAHRLFPLCRMTESGKHHALEALNSLSVSAGTNILEGLRKGTKVILDRKETNPFCSIMLLTDGQDTYTSKSRLLRKCKMRIPVYAFGFGSDHDPFLLHSMSKASGGTYSFIEAENGIQDAFARCIGGLLSVVVQNLQVHIQTSHPKLHLGSSKSKSYSISRLNDNRVGFINVGDLYADEERDFLVLLNVPAADDSNDETELIRVCCTYRNPISKQTIKTDVKIVKIQRPEMVTQEYIVVSMEVDRQRNRLRAYEAMVDSFGAARKGDLYSAWNILERARMELLKTVAYLAGDELCVALDAEMKEMQERMGNFEMFKSSGKAYMLSSLSSHSSQRATTRGHSRDSLYFHVYQTPSMGNYIHRSQTT